MEESNTPSDLYFTVDNSITSEDFASGVDWFSDDTSWLWLDNPLPFPDENFDALLLSQLQTPPEYSASEASTIDHPPSLPTEPSFVPETTHCVTETPSPAPAARRRRGRYKVERKKKKVAQEHCVIEKRYRHKVENNLEKLKASVPTLALAMAREKSGDGAVESSCSTPKCAMGLEPARKITKAIIYEKTVEYIAALEERCRSSGSMELGGQSSFP